MRPQQYSYDQDQLNQYMQDNQYGCYEGTLTHQRIALGMFYQPVADTTPRRAKTQKPGCGQIGMKWLELLTVNR
jgi:hypothetical protein